jgi:multidrug efflux pump
MFVGTLFTLFVVHSIYMLIARDHGKDREIEAGAAEAATDA